MDTTYEGKQRKDVLLNTPNIICYVRLLFFSYGIWRAFQDDYLMAVSMYILHWALDLADGHVARNYNQCSKFGAAFDMSLDVTMMTMWKAVLCMLYPKYAFFILAHAAFYILGDLLWMNSSEVQKRQGVTDDDIGSCIMKTYWKPKYHALHHFAVIGNWIFWLLLYIVNYTDGPMVPVLNVGIWIALLWLHSPFVLFRTMIYSAQTYSAVSIIVQMDINKKLKDDRVQ